MTISTAQKKAFAYIPYLQTVYRAGLVALVRTRRPALQLDWLTCLSSRHSLMRAGSLGRLLTKVRQVLELCGLATALMRCAMRSPSRKGREADYCIHEEQGPRRAS